MANIDMTQFAGMSGEGFYQTQAQTQTQTQGADTETHVYFESCEDSKTVTLSDVCGSCGGRTLDVAMTLRGVCPGKRTAVGISLSEVDSAGNEYSRGFRCVTVPAHTNPTCTDIVMQAVRFVLPEDIRVDGCAGQCGGRRHFIIRTSNNYVDAAASC